MNNPFKNNSLASGVTGVLIGVGATFGGQALVNNPNDSGNGTTTEKQIKSRSGNNFDVVPYDENGDVIITPNGKKYHNESCYTLSRSKRTQRVNSLDAEDAGLEPCTKCQ